MNNKILGILIIMWFMVVIVFGWILISTITSGHIETGELVPCLDANYRQFENEMCKEKISCANWRWDIGVVLNQIKLCDEALENKK